MQFEGDSTSSVDKLVCCKNLTKINVHERDQYITFEEEGHKYTISTEPNTEYTSVTTFNHSHFEHFDADKIIKNMMNGRNWNSNNKYWGMTAEEIKKQWADNGKEASGAGSKMHFTIECFMNNDKIKYPYTHSDLLKTIEEPISNDAIEWQYFINYVKDHPNLKPYRTEWFIFDEDLKLAGSIDMVYENDDGTYTIADWKRAREITKQNNFKKFAKTKCIDHFPDTNFWHYTMQLNTYKMVLEKKYNKKIKDLYLVRLHPNAKNYELIPIPDMTEELKELYELRLEQVKAKK